MVPDAHGFYAALKDATKDLVIVSDENGWCRFPRERFGDLARQPFRGRMLGDRDTDDLPSEVSQDHKGIKPLKPDRRRGQKFDGHNAVAMVAQERPPALRRSPSPLHHILRHRRLSDREAEHHEFAVDARCTPELILPAHLTDKIAQFALDLRSSSRTSRLPTPPGSITSTVPADHRLRPHDDYRPQKCRKQPIEPDQ